MDYESGGLTSVEEKKGRKIGTDQEPSMEEIIGYLFLKVLDLK